MLQTSYKYVNKTIAHITNPPHDEGSFSLTYSVNNLYYYPLILDSLQSTFLYYKEIQLITVTPDVVYDYIYSFIVYIEASGVIDNPLLRCKADTLVITPTIEVINGKQLILCEVPFYLIYNGVDLISNSSTSI
jgi:hypothetical protein